MIDALFWYTGLVAWILIVFGVVSGVVIEAHDRSVVMHGEQMKRRWAGMILFLAALHFRSDEKMVPVERNWTFDLR
jgi:hypothetical protein